MKLEWKTCFRIGISILLLYLCINYIGTVLGMLSAFISASFPLILGLIIAYLVNIVMSFYERYYFPKTTKKLLIRSRRIVCMTGAFISLLAIIILVVSLIIPQLISCLKLLFEDLHKAVKYLITLADKIHLIPESVITMLSEFDWKSRIEALFETVTSGVGDVMGSVFTMVMSVFSGVVTGFLSIIFAIYVLLAKEQLTAQIEKVKERYLGKKILDKVNHFIEVADNCFHSYIVGQCIEAVILGVLCTLGMLILRLPYAAMIGALMAFTALIPVAGAYIGAIVGALMILTVSPFKALIFLIFIVVLQQFEGNVIYPKVVGSSIGLPGLWVLAAITVGGGLAGIFGMLIGVPIAAIIYYLVREDVYKHEEKKKKADTKKQEGTQKPA